METALDEIASGEREGKVYLKTFWSQVSPLFGETIIEAVIKARSSSKSTSAGKTRKPRKSSQKTPRETSVNPEIGLCPKCGKALVMRKGKNGQFIGCSSFPQCRFTKDLP